MSKRKPIPLVRPDRSNACTVDLVPGGRLAYLWIGDGERHLTTIAGVTTLRRLARAILKELPPLESATRKKAAK